MKRFIIYLLIAKPLYGVWVLSGSKEEGCLYHLTMDLITWSRFR